MKEMCRLVAKNAHIFVWWPTEHDILVMPDADGLSSETVHLLFIYAECLSASTAPTFTSNVSVSQTYS